MDEVQATMAAQDGVIARRQVLALGGDDALIRTMVRRKEWARVHEGVYVDHTGPPSWHQRLWAALLFYGAAAACDESVLHLAGLRTGSREDVVHVAVAHTRRVTSLPDVRTQRLRMHEQDFLLHLSPPRMRWEPALLRVASHARDDASAIAVLADACQTRRTTAGRLTSTLRRHPKLPRRRVLMELLGDVASGAYSVLEHRYVTRVERPHGLPTAKRQRVVTVGRSIGYRDVEYLDTGLVVELDGRLGHEEANDRWDDMDRDMATTREGRTTVRVGWRQVAEPCRTAAVVGAILQLHGWPGQPRSCGPRCLTSARADGSIRGEPQSPAS